jgi:hypothetical protein
VTVNVFLLFYFGNLGSLSIILILKSGKVIESEVIESEMIESETTINVFFTFLPWELGITLNNTNFILK